MVEFAYGRRHFVADQLQRLRLRFQATGAKKARGKPRIVPPELALSGKQALREVDQLAQHIGLPIGGVQGARL